jgi:hypothetical protein
MWTLLLLAATAAPLRYEATPGESHDRVVIEWTDGGGAHRSVDARLPGGTLKAGRFHASGDDERYRAVAERLRGWAATDAPGLKVTADGSVKISGPPSAVAWGREALPRARAEVYAEMGLTVRDDGVVVHDVTRIGLDAVDALVPVSEAAGSMLTARPLAERIMSMVQAIDYEAGRGDTFRSPAAVLLDGKGDCDEKVALFVALVRAQEPTLPMAVVTTDHHAFVALDLAPRPGDATVKVMGTTLLAAEPVGPGQAPLGQLDRRSRAALKSGNYRVWPVPPRGAAPPPSPTGPPPKAPGCTLRHAGTGRGPVAMYGAAADGDDQHLWLTSGSARDATYGDTLWRYTAADQTWTRLPTTPPLVPRRYATATRLGDELIVVGGYGADGLVDTVERIDLSTHTVTYGTPLPEPRYFHGAAAFDGQLWVAGGHRADKSLEDSVLRYDPTADRWTHAPSLSEPRDAPLVVVGDELLAFGGYAGRGNPVSDAGEARSVDGTGRALTTPPERTSAAAAVAVGDSVYLFGDYEAHGRVQRYHVPSDRWFSADVGFVPRRHAVAARVGHRVYVYGGNVATSGSWLDTFERYDVVCPTE